MKLSEHPTGIAHAARTAFTQPAMLQAATYESSPRGRRGRAASSVRSAHARRRFSSELR